MKKKLSKIFQFVDQNHQKSGKRGQNGEKIVKKYLNLSTKTIKKWVWKGTKFEPKARTSSKFYFGKSGSEKGRSSSRRRELRLSSILVYFGPTFLTFLVDKLGNFSTIFSHFRLFWTHFSSGASAASVFCSRLSAMFVKIVPSPFGRKSKKRRSTLFIF